MGRASGPGFRVAFGADRTVAVAAIDGIEARGDGQSGGGFDGSCRLFGVGMTSGGRGLYSRRYPGEYVDTARSVNAWPYPGRIVNNPRVIKRGLIDRRYSSRSICAIMHRSLSLAP